MILQPLHRSIVNNVFYSILEATGDVSKELFQEVLHRDSCVAIFTILFILSFFGSIDSDIHRENVCQVNSYWHRPNILCDWKMIVYHTAKTNYICSIQKSL